MSPEQIQKCIHDGIALALQDQLPIAVKVAVDSAVNGKVKALSDKVGPMADAYSKWLSWKRLAGIVFGIMLAIGGLIQTFQVLYGFISNYFVIGIK